jgi:hypothetical protein
MRKPLLSIISCIFFLASQAQAPQNFSYQGVARDNSGNVIASNSISIKILIRQSSPSGTVVYSEEQPVTTNQFGLFTLRVGAGINTTGDFSAIDWSNGPYYLETQMDADGGTAYQTMGNSQLLSVPYALYAANAGNPGLPGPTGATGTDGTNGATGATGTNGVTGATGTPGTNGATGTAGTNGATGATGTAGTNGATGATGTPGTNGATGATGTPGTNGATGATGTDGTNGATGATGTAGTNGAAGATGTTGTNGATGTAGTNGATGATGTNGVTGATGTPGTNGATGTAGTNGATGATGTAGTNGATGIAGTNGATGATGTAGTNGATGATGTAGANGTTGATGTAGTNGVTGATGAAGTNGATGATGTDGTNGATGATGTAGTNGATGATGTNGVTGATGTPGTNGATGTAGTNGASGATGAAGTNGATGATGTPGTNGATGATGTNGVTGATGTPGTNGATGTAGTNGATGATGTAGTNGATGTTGTAGTNGATGATGTAGTNGATGNNGATGTTGTAGTNGATGASGNDGAAGPTGTAGNNGAPGATGATGLLANGTTAGNTPYWDGTQWVLNSSNIFNAGANVGVGTAAPTAKLEIGQPISGTADYLRAGTALTLDQSQNLPGYAVSIQGVVCWQTVQCGISGPLTSVELLLTTYFNFNQDVTVTIYSGAGIGGAVLGTVTVNTAFTNATQWYSFNLPAGINLTAGSLFTFYVTCPNTNVYGHASNGNPYPQTSSQGSADFAFHTYMGGNTAMQVYANGTTALAALQIENGAGSGKVLTSDATGNATWQTPAADADNQTLSFTSPNLYIANGNSVNLNALFVRGEFTVGTNAVGGVKTNYITFPAGSFLSSAVVKVLVTVKTENFTDMFIANVKTVDYMGFNVMTYRLDSPGGTWGQNLKVEWMAWE